MRDTTALAQEVVRLRSAEYPGPVQPAERIELLDVLRGFALIGVLYVNMHNFGSGQVTGPMHATAAFVMDAFFQAKFFSLFSLLFGIGFALQMQRAEEQGGSFFGFYWRRLVVLLGIGWVHALIYAGDILELYAVLAFALFLFKRWPVRRLVIAAMVILGAVYTQFVVSAGIPALRETATVVETTQDDLQQDSEEPSLDSAQARADARLRAFTEGSFFDVVLANLSWHERRIGVLSRYGLRALALFLLGMGIVRSGVLRDVEAHRRGIRRFMWWMLSIGSLQVVSLAYYTIRDPAPSLWLLVSDVVYPFGNPALALGYASFITLQLSKPGWHRVLHPLAAVGRVALSAYVGQSVVYTTIYYAYGLGLYGRLGPAHILPLAAVIFAVEVVFCNWWIRRFRFGPLEWLWRSATYMKWQPMVGSSVR